MDEPNLYCPHLLICRSIWYDGRRMEQGFSLGGILTRVVPDSAEGFPYLLERAFAYIQLAGDPGEYLLRIRLVRVEPVGYDEEVEIQLSTDGEPREFAMPTRRPATVAGLVPVEEFAFPMESIPFPVSGTYEFQLWVDGIGHPVGRERIEALEDA